jgi:hypothetical protein
MTLDLTAPEVAILDQWREEIDKDYGWFDTWDEFVDFIVDCQEGRLDRTDERWVEREVSRIINIKFRLSAAYLDPHTIQPDNFPREYAGRHQSSWHSAGCSLEQVIRDEIRDSGYQSILLRDLAED